MLPYNPTQKFLARELRKNATPEENELWYNFLSTYPVRFLRQRPIGRYIADFYCHSRKLIIELDGKQHEQKDAIEYDNIRTEFFNSMGISVIRFTNSDINTRFDYVRDIIKSRAPVLNPSSKTPFRKRGKGDFSP